MKPVAEELQFFLFVNIFRHKTCIHYTNQYKSTMKKQLYFILVLLFSITAFGQEKAITVTNNDVMLNGSKILLFKKVLASEYSFYNTANKEVLVFMIRENGTVKNPYDDYIIINFLQIRIKVVTEFNDHVSVGLGSAAKRAEKLLNWLYDEKVINDNGTFNAENADTFYRKYNDEVIARGRYNE